MIPIFRNFKFEPFWRVRRIKISAAFVSISMGDQKGAKRLFRDVECRWSDILQTFARSGLIEIEKSDDFEPLAEEKYVRRCGQDSVRSFIISNSLEELEKKSDKSCAKIWLEILIESESPSVVFDAICDLEKLQIELDWKYFQKKLKNLADSSDIIELSSGPTAMTSKYCASIAQELLKYL